MLMWCVCVLFPLVSEIPRVPCVPRSGHGDGEHAASPFSRGVGGPVHAQDTSNAPGVWEAWRGPLCLEEAPWREGAASSDPWRMRVHRTSQELADLLLRSCSSLCTLCPVPCPCALRYLVPASGLRAVFGRRRSAGPERVPEPVLRPGPSASGAGVDADLQPPFP